MRCIYCNTPLASIDYCPGCGADITIQKRIVRISNLLYNEGLDKALVRDMEGAITCLKRSLKFNKENTDARNLLGLCYYETGEAVSALCEWVVSKNIQPENNIADHYINVLQNNKNRLDTINQTIRKYNQSVLYCREDNEDMAIIQLKKVISQNAKYVKAHQLLALLYMKRKEYERARKLLRKAVQIDATNTTTLRYLQEIEEATGKSTNLNKKHKKYEKEEPEKLGGTVRYMSGTEMVIQPTTFRDSSTIATFINIILGILLGGAIVWFMFVPASRQAVNDSANRQVTDANTKLATQTVRVEELEGQIADYEDQVSQAEKERDDANAKMDSYEDLLEIAGLYVSGSTSDAAGKVENLDGSAFEGNAKTLYEALSGAVYSSLFDQYYNDGTVAYVAGDYQTAAEKLDRAVKVDPERTCVNHYNALLYLGMAYYNQGNTKKADEAFQQIVDYYPSKASEIAGYMSSSVSPDPDTAAADLSGLGDAATGQNAAGTGVDPSQNITIMDDQNAYTDNGNTDTGYTDTGYADNGYEDTGYDDSGYTGEPYVAWTDPVTGLHYDVDGNLLY